eukprot:m.366702 g.366702  ORF g.366702 m.366702 type:complete len:877 (+) comp37217_c0_seq1:149-2779(+)
MEAWLSQMPDHNGACLHCFTNLKDRLPLYSRLSVCLMVLLWLIDLYIGLPLLRCGHLLCCIAADRQHTFRVECLRSPGEFHKLNPVGSRRYLWTFGWADILSPPVNMLERRDSSWVTAIGFGLLSYGIPFVVNGAMELTQILAILIVVTPVIFCRHTRVPSLGLAIGFIAAAVNLGEVLHLMVCLGRSGGYINLISLLPALVCCMLLCGWYGLELKRRVVWIYRWARGYAPRPDSWYARALKTLDHSHYVSNLLANRIAVSKGESLTWQACMDTLRGLHGYGIPTRLVSAVILAICILWSILPPVLSYSSYFGALVEYMMSLGHCCAGVACDPTPYATQWLEDFLHIGVGLQIASGNECPAYQRVVRAAVTFSMAIASSISAVAVVFSLVHLLVVYRKRMLLLFRGKPDFITKNVPASESIICAVKFGGTQVASALGGWILGTFVGTLLLLFISVSSIIPLMGLYGKWFWPWWFRFVVYNKETHALGFPVLLVVNYWVLYLMVRYLFRIARYARGVQRRGLFHIVDLLEFVLYILNGLLGLIKRALTSMIVQALFVSRTDKSLMPRKYELLDRSYVAYLGFMQMDMFYSNPVLLTACYFLLTGNYSRYSKRAMTGHTLSFGGRTPGPLPQDRVTMSQLTRDTDQAHLVDEDFLGPLPALNRSPGGSSVASARSSHADSTTSSSTPSTPVSAVKKRVRLRNRWWLLITLHNNQGLAKYRFHKLEAKRKRRAKREAADEEAQACIEGHNEGSEVYDSDDAGDELVHDTVAEQPNVTPLQGVVSGESVKGKLEQPKMRYRYQTNTAPSAATPAPVPLLQDRNPFAEPVGLDVTAVDLSNIATSSDGEYMEVAPHSPLQASSNTATGIPAEPTTVFTSDV